MGALTDQTLKGPFALIHRVPPVPAVFVFPLAPQRVKITHPARGQVHQTLDSNWLDDFSGSRAVLTRIEIGGTFGYAPGGGGLGIPMHGSLHMRTLEVIFETFNALSRQLKKNQGAVQEYVQIPRLYFWRVWVERLEIEQRSQDPLLYFYSLAMVRLQDYLSPVGPALPPGIPGLSGPASAGALGSLF